MKRLKRSIVVLFISLLTMTALISSATASTIPYTDVTQNWAYSSIVTCYENGWITGTSSTTFSPKETLTRAQFVTILGRYAGASTSSYTSSCFTDVNFSSWGYAPYVAWAYERGIVHGTDETTFNPGGTVTRAQLAVFLYNYVDYLGVELEVTDANVSFSDESSIPSYAKKAVMALAQAGVISGSNGKFLPNDSCTREQAAAFLVKFNSALAKAEYGVAEPTATSLTESDDGYPVLEWNAVSGATGYYIYRREGSSGTWTRIAYYIKTTSYTDTTAEANTTYDYCVRSYVYKSSTGTRLLSTYGNNYLELTVVPAYTISPSSSLYNNATVSSTYYNSYTKHYYLINSYLSEMTEGGILILEAGTYNIPYTLYIPSNVTIKLKDGAVINKTSTVGSSAASASSILFAFVEKENSSVSNATSSYSGVSDSSIIGEGTATIKTSVASSTLFMLGHNDNITISNITMSLGSSTAYGIRIYGSRNVTISDCTSVSSAGAYAPVILYSAGGTLTSAPVKWIKLDKTVCKNITISGCDFSGTQYGVYTPAYVSGTYSTGIVIKNTDFSDITKDAVMLRFDSASKITGCTFTDIAEGSSGASSYMALHFYGSKNPTVTGNTFDNVPYAIFFSVCGSTYPTVSSSTLSTMAAKNTVGDMYKYFIAVKCSDGTTSQTYFDDDTDTFVINSSSTPFQKRYSSSSFYYNMKAALEQLDRVGGGTITIEAGTYTLNSTLYIPSNTEIILEDGVTINNGGSATVMFAFVSYQDYEDGVVYYDHDGVSKSSIHGESSSASAVINNKGVAAVVIEVAHTSNVSIYNLTMLNMNGNYHFMEVDANENLKIYNNTFSGCTDAGTQKEAINIDVPDANTGGFTSAYSSLDCTPNETVLIYNNTFEDLQVAVGTHMYTEDAAHTDIRIYKNTFTNMYYYGITARNWSDFKIYNNTFTDVGTGSTTDMDSYGTVFYLAGVTNPYITNNTITNADTLMRITALKYTSDNTSSSALLAYATVYNTISDYYKTLMYANTCTNVTRDWIYYRNTISGSYEKWYELEAAGTTFYIDTDSVPYKENYTDQSLYTEDTRLYYVIRSYMDHLEEIGGGTLELAAGTYPLTNIIYIPSDVTIIMDDDTVLQNATGSSIMLNFRSINISSLSDVDDYSAAENITISGGTIDANGYSSTVPMWIAKVDGVSIENVTFTGGATYCAKVLSSQDVTFDGCVFEGEGVSYGVQIANTYTAQCIDITVNDCTFTDMVRGILTNAQSTVYHQNITITNSTFDTCSLDAILLYEVENAVINNNTFKNITSSSYYCIKLYGMNGLEMNYNTFTNVYNCAAILYNSTYGVNTISDTNISNISSTTTYGSNVTAQYIKLQTDSSLVQYL